MRSAEHETWDVYMVTGPVRAGLFDLSHVARAYRRAWAGDGVPR